MTGYYTKHFVTVNEKIRTFQKSFLVQNCGLLQKNYNFVIFALLICRGLRI